MLCNPTLQAFCLPRKVAQQKDVGDTIFFLAQSSFLPNLN